MSSPRYKKLLEKSIQAAISAIEIYNKPDFKYREESFIMLMVNAWEILLKAKILKNTNRIESLYLVNKDRKKGESKLDFETVLFF